MKILFAAPENAWGEFLGLLRSKIPHHDFEATGRFGVDSLAGADVLIPTMGLITMCIKRSRQTETQKALGLEWVGGPENFPELLGKSDYVVLCLPVTPESLNLMDHKAFGFMKPGSFLVNVSRGGLVNREALAHALSEDLIAGAGLDVFWEEPPDPEDPRFRQNLIATPHIAGCTEDSMRGIVAGVAKNIGRIERGEEPLNTQ